MVAPLVRAGLVASLMAGLGPLSCPPSKLDQRVYLLMECEECVAGEEDSVVAFGQDAVPSLERLLAQGPPPVAIERYRRFLYHRARALAGRGVGPSDSIAYAEGYLDAYRATYRIRAATALARIGGARAEGALRSSLTRYRVPAVQAALRFALDSLWHP
jgi:hypothetical protein